MVEENSALTQLERRLRVVISIRLLLLQHGAKIQALDGLISKKPGCPVEHKIKEPEM